MGMGKVIVDIIFVLVLLVLYLGMHESIHTAINSDYGCDSSIQLTWSGVHTQASNCEISEGLQFAQALNEIVGYTVMFVLFLMVGYKIGRD